MEKKKNKKQVKVPNEKLESLLLSNPPFNILASALQSIFRKKDQFEDLQRAMVKNNTPLIYNNEKDNLNILLKAMMVNHEDELRSGMGTVSLARGEFNLSLDDYKKRMFLEKLMNFDIKLSGGDLIGTFGRFGHLLEAPLETILAKDTYYLNRDNATKLEFDLENKTILLEGYENELSDEQIEAMLSEMLASKMIINENINELIESLSNTAPVMNAVPEMAAEPENTQSSLEQDNSLKVVQQADNQLDESEIAATTEIPVNEPEQSLNVDDAADYLPDDQLDLATISEENHEHDTDLVDAYEEAKKLVDQGDFNELDSFDTTLDFNDDDLSFG